MALQHRIGAIIQSFETNIYQVQLFRMQEMLEKMSRREITGNAGNKETVAVRYQLVSQSGVEPSLTTKPGLGAANAMK